MEKNIYDLKLHQMLYIENLTTIIRVPGGWIYSFNNASEVFVPFSTEFETFDQSKSG